MNQNQVQFNNQSLPQKVGQMALQSFNKLPIYKENINYQNFGKQQPLYPPLKENNISNYYIQQYQKKDDGIKIDPKKLKNLFQNMDRQLENSSKDKDIVVLFGMREAGKSTLMNTLCGTSYQNPFSIENRSDPENFDIELKYSSQSQIPKNMNYFNKYNMYDFTSVYDQGNTEFSFLNAALINSILYQAKLVKIIFVVHSGSLTSIGGLSFINDMIQKVQQLIPQYNLIDNSILLVTKVENQDQATFEREVQNKLIPPYGQNKNSLIENLLKKKAVLKISKLFSRYQELEEEKNIIWNKLNSIQGTRIQKVNTNSIFASDEAVQDLCFYEMEIIFNHFFSIINLKSSYADEQLLTLIDQLNAMKQFKDYFYNEIKYNRLIQLLSTYSYNIVCKCEKAILEKVTQKSIDLDNHIKTNEQYELQKKQSQLQKNQSSQNLIQKQQLQNVNSHFNIQENKESQNKINIPQNCISSVSFNEKNKQFNKLMVQFYDDALSIIDLSKNKKNQIDPMKLKKLFDEHLANNLQLLNSSHNKNIIVIIGNTGSGKSTLANILCGKKLIAMKGDIIIKQAFDSESFKIGHTADSQTLLPQFMHIKETNIYDLAGFRDSRGTEYSFLNAAFIKNILLLAKTVKIIFAVEYGSLISDRGQNFVHFVNSYGTQLIPECNIVESSLLVVTKVDQQSQQDFEEEMNKKLAPRSGHEQNKFIQSLINNLAILKISKPSSKSQSKIDFEDEKNLIWNKLNSIQGIHIQNVNTCSVFTSDESKAVKDLCNHEMQIILNNIFLNFDPKYPQNDEQLVQLRFQQNAVNKFKNNFENQIEQSKLISLLKLYSNSIFSECYYTHLERALKLQENLSVIIQSMEDDYQQLKQIESIQQQNESLNSKHQILEQELIKAEKLAKLMQESQEQLEQQNREKKEKEAELEKKFPLKEGTYRIQCCEDDQYLFSTKYDKLGGNRVLQSHSGRKDTDFFYIRKSKEEGYLIFSCQYNGEFVTSWEKEYQGLTPLILSSNGVNYKPTTFQLVKQKDGSYHVFDTNLQKFWQTQTKIKKFFDKVVFLGSKPSNFLFRSPMFDQFSDSQ